MAKYKIKTVFSILLIGALAANFASCSKSRTPIAFELPLRYVGWITVKFEKPDAPPLKAGEDGFYHLKISDSGYAETSSQVEEGWAEDKYFWMDSTKEFVLQQYSEDKTTMIHSEAFSNADYRNFANPDTLQIGKEYTLYDGSKVTKLDDKGGMSYESGRYLLFTFYVSMNMENVWDYTNYKLPPIPKEHTTW
jgi:hypothetical protein